MATIQSSLVFQDKMSAAIQSVTNALESANISAKLAKMNLDDLERAQKEWKATLDAAQASATKNTQNVETARKKYEETSKAVDKATLQYLKYESQVVKNSTKLEQLKKKQEDYNKKLDDTSNKVNKSIFSFETMQGKVITLASAFQLFNQAIGMIRGLGSAIDRYIAKTEVQSKAESQLAIIAKQRMNLTNNEVQSLFKLAASQQKLGVVGDEVTIAGMANISSFVKQKSSIEALTPSMNNLAVKMYGYNVTAENMSAISRSLGRAMLGDVGALSRLGVKIDDNQKKWLMSLSEQERAIKLAEIINSVTGDMNAEMAKTPFGRITQANNAIGDSYEKLGNLLLPLKVMFTETMATIIGGLANNLTTIVPILTVAIGIIIAAFIALKWEAISSGLAAAGAWIAATAPFWIIIGVIGLVSVALNLLGISFQDQAEAIVIAFNWVITALKNIWIALQNTWTFASNVVKNFVSIHKLMLAHFFGWVLQKLDSIAKMMDAVFHTNISQSIQNLSKATDKAKEELSAKIKGNMTPYKNFEANDLSTNKAKAQKFMNGTSNALNSAGIGGIGGVGGVGGISPDLTTSTPGGKAIKTKNQGEIKIAQEDIKLLHDIATRDYMVNYQQLTPQVTLQGLTVNELVDANQVVDMIVDGISEAADAKLQVVS